MKPELLAPAGSFDAAVAAFQFGADAVYLGLPNFSARADADNLTPERLRVLLAYARSFTPAKKIYVTFNTLVKDGELAQAVEQLETLAELAPDGLIVQDLGVARLIRDSFPSLELHASTQLAAHSLAGVLALKELGFKRVVLARELTLDEIAEIVRKGGVEIEIFIHGALCYSMSGLCLFSSHKTGRSGNRGRCAYCCRELFKPEGGAACFPFSMKDLALGPILPQVVATGAQSLKIEGRMKSPFYVACVTDYYRRKLDGRLGGIAERDMVQDLQTVFSRPWTSLYAEGLGAAPDSIIDPIGMGHRGARIGEVEAVITDQEGTHWLRFKTNRALEKHDGIQVDLPSGGKPFGCAVNILRRAGNRFFALTMPANSKVEVALPTENLPMLPPGSPIYCSASQAVRRRYEPASVREASLAIGSPVDIAVSLVPDGIRARAKAECPFAVQAEIFLASPLAPSEHPERTPDAARKAFSRLGGTDWFLRKLSCDDPAQVYAPLSILNDARRQLAEALTKAFAAQRAAHIGSVLAPFPAQADAAPAASRWVVKCFIGQQPCAAFAEAGEVVLDIGHLAEPELDAALKGWTAVVPSERLRLALPLLTRAREAAALDAAIARLSKAGFAAWEAADLSGCLRLRKAGITSFTADWSLYAFNRAAVDELRKLGVSSFVLSPELDAAALASLDGQLLVYQHTPLFLSETSPCLPCAEGAPLQAETRLDNRDGEPFTVVPRDGRWHTVSGTPYSASAFEDKFPVRRVDFSWSPGGIDFEAVFNTLRAGQPLPCAAGNLNRELL